jgi:hypothetical protein
VRFEAFMVVLRFQVFWDVMLYWVTQHCCRRLESPKNIFIIMQKVLVVGNY